VLYLFRILGSDLAELRALRLNTKSVLKKNSGGFPQLAISVGSSQPSDLVVWDTLPVIVFLNNLGNPFSFFHMSFNE
jgi:hypothetical protein